MKTQTNWRPDTAHGELILVNAKHPLPAAHTPDLAALCCDSSGTLLAAPAARMLDFCITACRAVGKIRPVSGYRTREEQRDIFRDSLAENGEAFTRKYVALPGCSEHETGLAIDLAGADGEVDFIRPNLPNTGVYRHFREHAADYGFVLRYPKGKTHITGIGHEPWHFRYVGWPHSKIMVQKGLVLEEYIELLNGCTGPDNALEYTEGSRRVQIFTQSLGQLAETATSLTAQGRLWQASGNNTGGMVVTVWH